ncbi:MAG: hypothetical protein AAF547_01395 [Actinomycetota bacterium]
MSDQPTTTEAVTGADLRPVLALAVLVVAVPLMVGLSLVFALLPGPWWLGIPLGLLIAAAVVAVRVANADRTVLSGLGGGLHNPDDGIRLTNMVQGLSLAGGVVEPELVVLNDDARNAMAVRNRGRNHLVVTQGLLAELEVVELEGLVAELLSRLRNGDAEAATVGAALFGRPILDGPLAPILGPLARAALDRLLSEHRDLEADRQAVSLTRYPPGLLGALSKIAAGSARPGADAAGLAHLWLVDPRPAAEGQSSRAPLDLRIDILAEL